MIDPSERPTPGAVTPATILVVDDEPTVRLLIAEVLEELGHPALEAGNAAEGLALLRAEPRISLLISDVGLPNGMNGRQFAEIARTERPGLKVLFVTGYGDSSVVDPAVADPTVQVLVKPFQIDTLIASVRALLGVPAGI